mmetsp:Transcript_32722/g.75333  ORF Transcript_32722/g.75333 Transcript_32722/m.75333 type:complete len:262 (-) Transcript_32722:139-924(-)
MRHGRAKAARKTLQFFRLSYGIAPPYHVLLDGTFLVAMTSQKVPLRERLDRVLQHKSFHLYVSRSSLTELEKMSKKDTPKKEALKQAWRWGLDECDEILEDARDEGGDGMEIPDSLGVPGKDVVRLVSLERSQYMVATQDEELLDFLRTMGNAPLLRLARGVLLLENPSKSSQRTALREEKSKWTVAGSITEHEKRLVDHVKDKQRREQEQARASQPQRRVKRKAKEPNPLSCKRKKDNVPSESTKRKRRRTKKSSKEQES